MVSQMQENWSPGRYINIYKMDLDRHNRDCLFRRLKSLDPSVYDLRIEEHWVELSYFIGINSITGSIMGKNFFTSSINYIQNVQSFPYAIYLIKENRYWEAHEVLENNWRNSSGIEKTTYQYIILMCAAGVHMQRGHDAVCKNIVTRANGMKTLDIIENLNISRIKSEKNKNPYSELSTIISSELPHAKG